MEFIARLSKSKFKIGRFTEAHDSYDLMFELDENQKLEDFLDHIKKYINLINRPN
jgi:hypothetical protein